ncbi:MAG: hypothetical protein IJ463_00185 [Bacilli bacterium]|nr:hypothetical protein [Bacilli bacterium]
MKKNLKVFNKIKNSKYNKLIYIGLILVVIIIIFLISLLFKDSKKELYEKLDKQNSNIVVSDVKKEIPGTHIRSLESLKKKHCLDDVCIKNIMIYYRKNSGRIEYEIVNNGKRKVSGAFKLKFDNGNSTYIVYTKLKKGESRKGVISFSNNDYSNVYDYTLNKLKDKELKKLLNSK